MIGPWSLGYTGFLLVVAAGGVVPWWLWTAPRRLGERRARRIVTGIAVGLALLWLVAARTFDLTRVHEFDIWLQMSPPMTEVPRPRTPGVARILCLGGSTTRGPGLDDAARYPNRLQSRLAGDGLEVEVINAGMYWYTSRHSQVAWSLRWRAWQPDVVVVMHAFNDLARSFSPDRAARGAYREDWGHYFGPALPAAERQSFESWLWHGPLHWLDESWASRWRTRWIPLGPDDFRSRPQFEEAYGGLLEDLIRSGCTVVAVTQPSRFATAGAPADRRRLWATRDLCSATRDLVREVPDPESMAAAMGLYNDVVRTRAARMGATLVEGAGALPGDWEHFSDGIHHTARGADRLAAVVAGALREHPALEEFRSARPGP